MLPLEWVARLNRLLELVSISVATNLTFSLYRFTYERSPSRSTISLGDYRCSWRKAGSRPTSPTSSRNASRPTTRSPTRQPELSNPGAGTQNLCSDTQKTIWLQRQLLNLPVEKRGAKFSSPELKATYEVKSGYDVKDVHRYRRCRH